MATRIGNTHRVVIDKHGKSVLVEVKKRYDASAEQKRATSNKTRVVRPAAKGFT